MGKERINVADGQEVKIAGPDPHQGVMVEGRQDVACYETGPDGQPRLVWKQEAKNALVQQGLGMLGNCALGRQTATSNGPFLVLHQANATNTTYAWAQLSSLHPADTMYSASLLPLTFASTDATATQWAATTCLSFSINTTTISGAALIFYTSASCSNAPANSSDVKLFNIGSFSAAQAVQSGNTLSVSISIRVSTS